MALTVLEAPSDHSWSKNLIPLYLESSIGYGAYFDINIFVSADFYNSGTFILLATQRLYVNNIGRAELNMQSILDASFGEYEHPDITSPSISNITDKINLCEYQIQEYDATGSAGDYFEAQFDLYRGGFPKEYEKGNGIPQWFTTAHKWLTWKPIVSVVSKRQPEMLAIKLPVDNSVSTLLIKFTAYFDSGNDFDYEITGLMSGQSAFDIFFVPVGADVNDLSSLEPSANLLYYTVTAINFDSTALICETRKYIIDPIDRPFERFFLFQNSVMGFDVLRTIGYTSLKSTFADVDADVTPSVYSGDKTPSIQRLESIEDAVRTVNTGFKSKEEIDWLRDLRLSRDVYELDTSDMESLIPILLTKKEILPGKDNDDVHALQFDYKRAYDNNTYSGQSVR